MMKSREQCVQNLENLSCENDRRCLKTSKRFKVWCRKGFSKPLPFFSGRKAELKEFKNILPGKTVLSIRGTGGIGKTEFTKRCLEITCDPQRCIWFDCRKESTIDMLIIGAGYPETARIKHKSEREKYIGFLGLIQRDKKIIVLDNYQSITNKEDFNGFLQYAGEKKTGDARILVLSREKLPDSIRCGEIILNGLEGLKEIEEYVRGFTGVMFPGRSFAPLDYDKLGKGLKGHPLALNLILLLIYGASIQLDSILETIKSMNPATEEDLCSILLDIVMEKALSPDHVLLLREFSVIPVRIERKDFESIWKKRSKGLQCLIKMMFIKEEGAFLYTHRIIREAAGSYLTPKERADLSGELADYFISQAPAIPDIEKTTDIFYYLGEARREEEIADSIIKKGESFASLGFLTFITGTCDWLREKGCSRPEFNYFYGWAFYDQKEWKRAAGFFKKACFAEKIETRIRLDSYNKCGEALYSQFDHDEAFNLWEKAAGLAEKTDFMDLYAKALLNMGYFYKDMGRDKEAEPLFKTAYSLYDAINDNVGKSSVLTQWAGIYKHHKDKGKTLDFYLESLQLLEDADEKDFAAGTLNRIGRYYDDKGDRDRAAEYYKKTLEIVTEIGDASGIATSTGNISNVYRNLGKDDDAVELYKKNLELYREIGDKEGIAGSLHNIAIYYGHNKKYEQAFEYFRQCQEILEELGNNEEMVSLLTNMGAHELLRKNFSQSLIYYEKTYLLCKKFNFEDKIDNLYSIITSLINLVPRIVGTTEEVMARPYLPELLAKLVHDYHEDRTDESKKWVILFARNIGQEAFYLLFKKLPPFLQDHYVPDYFLPDREVHNTVRVGRNDPCPCGSGKKYKKCCGR